MSLFERDEIIGIVRDVRATTKKVFDKEEKQYIFKRRLVTSFEKEKIVGREQVHEYLYRIGTVFASYIKHKERGKKDRRAICSATIIMRMFLYVMEEFHLELSKQLPGATISIGGEEKKAKIANNLSNNKIEGKTAHCISQGTEDAAKWNECLSPQAFASMHHYLFQDSLRMSLMLPPATEMGKLFRQISVMGNYLQARKAVQLGKGPIVTDGKKYTRLHWTPKSGNQLNEENKKWFEQVKGLLVYNDEFLRCSVSMLMGMLNAGSTTLGLLPVNHRMKDRGYEVICMRSSDDTTTSYKSQTSKGNRRCIEHHRRNLSMIGINLSPAKTFFFKEGFGEYTSWYMDLRFVAQYGVETTSQRPQGKNPYDDLYAIAKGTSTALSTLNINPLGASIRLRVGILNIKRIWRIQKNYSKYDRISGNVQIIDSWIRL